MCLFSWFYKNAQSTGYLFLQYLLLIVFLEIREKLNDNFTVDQALMALRTLKFKVYDSKIIVQEKTKIHKKIFELADLQPEAILVPNSWGI
ncbi:MAG: hypothetical protein P1U74_00980 [Legionellaceae bacterium]|nr:hypothetical protein [Legionellaceae bacterium]